MNDLPLDISSRGATPEGSNLALEQFLQQQDTESALTQYIQVLVRQRWIVLAIIAAGIFAALFINATTVKLYRSTASLEIAREAARVVNVDDTAPKSAAMSNEFYQTQYGLLRSRALAEQTVASLRLADNVKFLYGYGGGKVPANALTGDRRRRELAAAGQLMAHLTVEPVRGSSLVSLSFDSPDPDLSAAIVNALAKNFITSNLDRRFQASAYARQFLQQQIEATRQKLEASERALVAYAGQQRIIDYEGGGVDKNGAPTPGQSVESTDLRALNDALNAAKIDRAQAEARYQQAARSAGLNAPESLADNTINQLRSQRAELQGEYQRLSATFRPDYPQMVALRQQIAEIEKQLGRQGSVVLDSLRSAYQAAAQRQNDLQRQVDTLKNSVINLRGRSVQYQTLQRDADTNRALYDALLQRYKEIGIAGGVGTNNVSIVDAGLPQRGPVTPRTTMNLLLGLLLGALIGAAVAFMLEQLDESIIAPHDLERKLGVPLLGSVPRVPDSDVSLDLLEDSKNPLAEAYLSLQTALRLTTSKGAPRVLFVTSSRPSEGKSTTAMAVARNFAALGRKTILIDADLRNPSVHKMLGFANAAGLTNILAGAEDMSSFIRPGPVERLSIMSSGPIPPNPAELLAGPNLPRTFERLLETYDHIVVDGPPVLGLADAPLIASYAEATMFVIAAKNTHTRTARVSLRRLADVHANILGAVLTKFDAKKVGYDYGYNYEYGEKRIGFLKRATG
ncbi:GumC family protein [Sphingomonas sp.]|jgi:capsular exopolysaccharide synthesis family protein|uniref:GumC family protein n=1 Tax=Sphingomonas sp. TaxID=28214 RepID=UPI002E326FC9|nr:polysaccharide biosynthesis tyrosine autokinase [Sphingomonas sp.]HEX4695921.1 polysaccharide biosynthesis tyrosine autokinase [Sphingomonas sp.]